VCVTVHNCARRIGGLDQLPTREMTISQFLEWWDGPRLGGAGGGGEGGGGGGSGGGGGGGENDRSRETYHDILYLKDWNFGKEFPGYGLYVWPPWFREDWLNQYEVCVCVCVCVCVRARARVRVM